MVSSENLIELKVNLGAIFFTFFSFLCFALFVGLHSFQSVLLKQILSKKNTPITIPPESETFLLFFYSAQELLFVANYDCGDLSFLRQFATLFLPHK